MNSSVVNIDIQCIKMLMVAVRLMCVNKGNLKYLDGPLYYILTSLRSYHLTESHFRF